MQPPQCGQASLIMPTIPREQFPCSILVTSSWTRPTRACYIMSTACRLL